MVASGLAVNPVDRSEEAVAAALLDAQGKAKALFEAIDTQNLVRPGVAETRINESIYALAARMYAPDLTVREDDIVFLDLGPVFEEWETDFGRTYVVGNEAQTLSSH